MRGKRVAISLVMLGLLLATGCCRMCHRWCDHRYGAYGPPPTCCAPAPCCPTVCCPAETYQGGCTPAGCTAAGCATPVPAPATIAAPAGQWQRSYKPNCTCN